MSDKLEQLKCIIMRVIVVNDFVDFGSENHFKMIDIVENIKSIEEFKEIDNIIIHKAIDYISKNDKVLNMLENDIGIKIEQIK